MSSKEKKPKSQVRIGEDPIWDVRSLSKGKQLVLGLQHMFAMFGATVLVPLLTGLNISTTLFMAGAGTLLFHLATNGEVPAFLGSSFAFLGGYAALAPMVDGHADLEQLQYANGGIFVSGILFLLISLLIKKFGVSKIMRIFPPVVTGPMIIAIGIGLAPTAVNNASENWPIAFLTIAVVIIFNIWGKGMAKVIPIMLGIIAGYIAALLSHSVDFSVLKETTSVFAFPLNPDRFMKINLQGVATMVPISLATLMEHIGDISAISATTGKNYMKEPGLNRTILGDAFATSFSTALGGPDMTTYGENVGVMALTKVYDPRVMRIAAVLAMILSFFPGVSNFIRTIPNAVIGGVSIILYGMIASTGVRNLVENRVDLSKSRNMIIVGCIFVCALGFENGLNFTMFGLDFNMPGIAIAAVVGIILNLILPGNDYEFDVDQPNPAGTGTNFAVMDESIEEYNLISETLVKRGEKGVASTSASADAAIINDHNYMTGKDASGVKFKDRMESELEINSKKSLDDSELADKAESSESETDKTDSSSAETK